MAIINDPRVYTTLAETWGGTDDDDLPAVVEPVHEREERGDDAGVDLVLLGGAHGREAVDLVEEDDGRLAAPRLLEQEPGGGREGGWLVREKRGAGMWKWDCLRGTYRS